MAARGLRTDIQGLRAVAVGGVVLYHLYPGLLPGGFAGVDVFFVISGFLITAHLVARPPERASDLLAFWARRVRRLLPASLLVLAATLVASRLVAPPSTWPDTARAARAAATYWINWLLASDSVDYLHSQDPPTAVQHFWSLSVEEQFYAGWPVLLLVLVWLARRLGGDREVLVLGGLGAVAAASLLLSVHLTATNPAAAYFVTQARIWELGGGALLGAWMTWHPTWRPPAAPVLAWAGVAGIATTFLTYGDGTPFPGWAALLPVLSTVLVIAAADAGPALAAVLARRPVQWVGDVSYSVYLWHWPLLVLLPFVVDSPGLGAKVGVVAVTLVLAGLTRAWVEDPMRRWQPRASLRSVFVAAAGGMAVVVALAVVQLASAEHQVAAAAASRDRALEQAGDPHSCVGAAALDDAGCPASSFDALVLPPAAAARDRPRTHAGVPGGKNCPGQEQNGFALVQCEFGDPAGTRTITLVGDSHAQHWLPALEKVAAEQHLRLTTRVSSGCHLAPVRQVWTSAGWTDGCLRWSRRTLAALIAEKPDLVVLANRTFHLVEGEPTLQASLPAYRAGSREVLQRLSAAKIPVLVLRDTPVPGKRIPLCLDEHPTDIAACDGDPRRWIKADSFADEVPAVQRAATAAAAPVRLLDLNDRLCTPRRCPAVIGDVVTYYDDSHMSATFNTTLWSYLDPVVRRLLAR